MEHIFGKDPKKYAREIAAVSTVSKKENIKLMMNAIVSIFGLIVVAICLASLVNLKFNALYVSLTLGSLLLFELLKLEQFMMNECRLLLPAVISYALWHFYARKILLRTEISRLP